MSRAAAHAQSPPREHVSPRMIVPRAMDALTTLSAQVSLPASAAAAAETQRAMLVHFERMRAREEEVSGLSAWVACLPLLRPCHVD